MDLNCAIVIKALPARGRCVRGVNFEYARASYKGSRQGGRAIQPRNAHAELLLVINKGDSYHQYLADIHFDLACSA